MSANYATSSSGWRFSAIKSGSSRNICRPRFGRCRLALPADRPLPHTWEEFKTLKQQVRDSAVHQLERRFLIEALERCDGNVSRAAEEIGIQRTNLHALIRKYGLSDEP